MTLEITTVAQPTAFLMPGITGWGSASLNDHDYAATAREAWELGNSELALDLIAKAIDRDPDHFPHYRTQVQYLSKSGYSTDAEQKMNEIMGRFQRNPQAWLFRAALRIAHGNPRGARRDLTRSIETGNVSAAAFAFRARTSEVLGEYEKALADLEIAATMEPESLQWPAARGHVQTLMRERAATIEVEILHANHPWESEASRRLKKELKAVDGTVLAGASIPHPRKGRINLDLVLICDRGVFVMECKSYRGKIEGGTNSRWNSVHDGMSVPVKSERGLNPLFQVEEQVFAVLSRVKAWYRHNERTETEDCWVHGAALFPDEASFNLGTTATDRFDGNAMTVFHVGPLAEAIRKKARKRKGLCSTREGRRKLIEWLKR